MFHGAVTLQAPQTSEAMGQLHCKRHKHLKHVKQGQPGLQDDISLHEPVCQGNLWIQQLDIRGLRVPRTSNIRAVGKHEPRGHGNGAGHLSGGGVPVTF